MYAQIHDTLMYTHTLTKYIARKFFKIMSFLFNIQNKSFYALILNRCILFKFTTGKNHTDGLHDWADKNVIICEASERVQLQESAVYQSLHVKTIDGNYPLVITPATGVITITPFFG